MLSETFWTQNIASSQFDQNSNYIREAKVRPIKNQLYSLNTPNYVREFFLTRLKAVKKKKKKSEGLFVAISDFADVYCSNLDIYT